MSYFFPFISLSLYILFVNFQVIPSLFSQPVESDEKTCDLFAYVSIGANKQNKQSNTSCGQIRKCNLTKSCLAGGVTLAEVHLAKFS